MDSTRFAILTGVASGLLTSAVVFLLDRLWKVQLSPWLSDHIYQGLRVDGTWILVNEHAGTPNSKFAQRETFELEQRAGRISGRLILDPHDGEELPSRTLKVHGSISDGFVMLSCTPATRRNLGFVSYLAKVAGDGAELRGSAVYYDIGQDRIECVAAVYRRAASDSAP